MKNDGILKSIQTYRWKSIYLRYFIAIVVVVMVFFVAYNVSIYTYYRNLMLKEANSFTLQNLSKLNNSFSIVFNEADSYYKEAISNDYVKSFLNIKELPAGYKLSSQIVQPINSSMLSRVNTSDFITSVHIWSFGNNNVLSSSTGGDITKFSEEEWYKYYSETNLSYFSLPVKMYEKNIITICRELDEEGLLIVNIDLDKVSNGFTDYDFSYYVSNEADTVLFSNDEEKISGNVNDLLYGHILTENLIANEQTSVMTREYIVASLKSPDGYIYSLCVDCNRFVNKMNGIWIIMFVCGVFLSIIVLILAFFITSSLYKSIANIVALFKNTQDSDSLDETTYITNNILGMINNLQKTEVEMTNRLHMLKKAQSVALQTQMNPHFLFNTLQMINLFIMKSMKGDSEASQIIVLLSDLLRITLNTNENIIPVWLEMKHAEKYIQIQNIRYKNKFNFEWNVSPKVESKRIIKLIIQPLLENCVEHAKREDESVLTVKIDIYQGKNEICLIISDDGLGMTKERLDIVSERMNEIPENEHIGLANVNQRMKLIYGDSYGIKIKSECGKGTTVLLSFPDNI